LISANPVVDVKSRCFALGKLRLLGRASTWGILRSGSNAPAASAHVEHSKHNPLFARETRLSAHYICALISKDDTMVEPFLADGVAFIDRTEPAARQQFPGFFDSCCPGLAERVRSFAATKHGFWTLIVLSPLLLVVAVVAFFYLAFFVTGPIIVAQAIWYIPKLNEIRAEYESKGIMVKAKVTKHRRTKEKNQYKVTAVYQAPQDSNVYARTFDYTVEGKSGMGINIGRVRLGFSEGPAFPQEMDFLVLPDHPASGQLREHIIQQESVFHRALMAVLGPIVYFVFAYYIPKEFLANISGCSFCHDAIMINVVAVVLLGLNLILAMILTPAFHAQNVKTLFEGACLAGLEAMDVEQQPDSIMNVGVSRRGVQLSTTENGRSQAFGFSFT
jgi:hypothetical protein